MLTGTPLDLTPFASVLTGVGVIYWLLALAALIVAVKVPKTRRSRLLATLAALCLLAYLPASGIVRSYSARSALAEATAHFEMRCKTSGEKVTRTVANVEGVVWMKWRARETNFDDQFKLDDPYGRDCGGEDCIAQLLRVTSGAELNPEEAQRHRTGYRFIESLDPRDGQAYRYVGVIKLPDSWTPAKIEEHRKTTGADVPSFSYRFLIERAPIAAYTAGYGVMWDDISSPDDRKRWIAGSSFKVIDLSSNELLAERIGFLFDRGLGSTGGARSPWTWARVYGPACPPIVRLNAAFLTRVLQPSSSGE